MDIILNDANVEIDIGQDNKVFGKHEEKAIISLAFDQPDFFMSFMQFLKSDYFQQFETRFVFDIIKYHYTTHGVILSRNMSKDIVNSELTADDPFEAIYAIIDRESDPREVPIITDKLLSWTKRKSMLRLYDKETIEAVERGEFDDVEKIIEESGRITNVGDQCHFFFDELEPLFIENKADKFTTGFMTLDMSLNEGGPERGEVFCVLAATGGGKSIFLVNVGAANVKKSRNVLHVTLEMTWKQTAMRYMCCFSNVSKLNRFKAKQGIMSTLSRIKATYNSDLIIAEYPPDEISVDHIHATIDMLRKIHGINIDVVIIDYLELLMSRQTAYNKDDYTRQKRACTETDRLAKKEGVVVFTATQGNRSANDGQAKGQTEQVIDITQVAESYGKTMPLSYLVTINQTKQEYEQGKDKEGNITNAQCRFFIAKNRNGPKFTTIDAKVNYETIRMSEYESLIGKLGNRKLNIPETNNESVT